MRREGILDGKGEKTSRKKGKNPKKKNDDDGEENSNLGNGTVKFGVTEAERLS